MANDFYPYDNEDESSYTKMVALCVAAASLVVLVFLIILYLNTEKKNAKLKDEMAAAQETVVEDDFLASSNPFTSKELDFWKDAQSDNQPKENADIDELKKQLKKKHEDDPENLAESDESNEDDENSENDESEDEEDDNLADKGLDEKDVKDKENYISIKEINGDIKYYEIIPELEKNHYDFENCFKDSEGVISYKDNMTEGHLGIDLSKYNGEIDWEKVKSGGVEFAMLRLGSRGYALGELELDEKFVDYAQNANLNNILVGAYFFSQAITESEATEEANYIVGAIANFNVKYPVAIDIEYIGYPDARADKLTAKERTACVKAFCDTVKGYGYKPIIYASRSMLITGLDLKELDGYDVWLADETVPTDYPYEFNMWRYTRQGKVSGITGDVDLDMCFVDYERR